MLLACYSHKHISYRIRTIIRKAITFPHSIGLTFFCQSNSLSDINALIELYNFTTISKHSKMLLIL
ncbi:hypothetical protein [Wolbachia endosymbiont (group A) of Nomada hirtipes]|uniref:hypothetical protein n=1 Tax=Wolbachia endosymbiont (group A) of Nomada hirtipes TaxID=3066208 RepID=UPI0030CA777F